MEGDPEHLLLLFGEPLFQSTPSVWRETRAHWTRSQTSADFNPLPPCGGRLFTPALSRGSFHNFNPLPPCGGRLNAHKDQQRCHDFNPLPPCGGRRGKAYSNATISHFNPLPPCGGRHDGMYELLLSNIFQSTPSVWRETSSPPQARLVPPHFNPLPPCGGRLDGADTGCICYPISIHSLRVEGDDIIISCQCHYRISIHSLRVEGDDRLGLSPRDGLDISIHSLRVEGDPSYSKNPESFSISIHSLRVEGDPAHRRRQPVPRYFNPLPPCGGRP